MSTARAITQLIKHSVELNKKLMVIDEEKAVQHSMIEKRYNSRTEELTKDRDGIIGALSQLGLTQEQVVTAQARYAADNAKPSESASNGESEGGGQ